MLWGPHSECLGTRCNAGDSTQIGAMQGKCLPHRTVSLALTPTFLTAESPLDSDEQSTQLQDIMAPQPSVV